MQYSASIICTSGGATPLSSALGAHTGNEYGIVRWFRTQGFLNSLTKEVPFFTDNTVKMELNAL